jgi:hypothetical protein
MATQPIGRVVHTECALPTLTPVNFRLYDGDVVLQAGRASSLGRVPPGTVVAFEVDDYDDSTGSGWSVVLTGRIADDETITLPTRPHDRVIRLHPEVMTGRRVDAGGPRA